MTNPFHRTTACWKSKEIPRAEERERKRERKKKREKKREEKHLPKLPKLCL